MNQAGNRCNLLYLVAFYLFPYLSFGRDGCEAICLFLLEAVAKKRLSRFTQRSHSPQPAPSSACPSSGAPLASPHPFPHLPTSSPESHWPLLALRQRDSDTPLHLYILPVIRTTWTDGILTAELSFAAFEYESGGKRNETVSAQKVQREPHISLGEEVS